MNRFGSVAARLPKSERLDLAVRALANSESITDLAAEHGVSRKFVYEQKGKASAALDEAFAMDASDEEGLFDLKVTRRWLRQVILSLTLICRSSVIKFLRDLLGVHGRGSTKGYTSTGPKEDGWKPWPTLASHFRRKKQRYVFTGQRPPSHDLGRVPQDERIEVCLKAPWPQKASYP